MNSELKEARLNSTSDEEYDVKSISFPRTTGIKLFLLAKILNIPILGGALVKHIMKVNGLNTVMEFANTLDKVYPTLYPLLSDFCHQHTKEEMSSREIFDFKSYKILSHSLSMPTSFRHWTIADYIALYNSPKSPFSPNIAAERILEILQENDSSKMNHCFISFNKEDILLQARASTERYKSKKTLGPLDGIPIAIKDEFHIKGYVTTMGTSFMKTIETADSPVITKLKRMGAIIIGKTNMHEIGLGTTGHNLHYNTPINPYSKVPSVSDNGTTPYYTGGSSSGSAYAVASGIVPISIGADGGGSVRIPASLCGVYGIKATFGRIEHVSESCGSVHHVGVFGTCMRDISLVYGVIASSTSSMGGETKEDEGVIKSPLFTKITKPIYIPKNINDANTFTSIHDLVIGIYPQYFDDADHSVRKACRNALDFLLSTNKDGKGPSTQEISIPRLQIQRLAHSIVITSEMASYMMRYSNNLSKLSPETRGTLALGQNLTAPYLLSAQKVRTDTIQIFRKIFEDVDIILTPTSPITAPPILPDVNSYGESNLSQTTNLMRFVTLGNFLGLPAISVPVGYDDNGLPIGLQIIGRWWDEDIVMRVAHVLEQGWMVDKWEKPSHHYNILEQFINSKLVTK